MIVPKLSVVLDDSYPSWSKFSLNGCEAVLSPMNEILNASNIWRKSKVTTETSDLNIYLVRYGISMLFSGMKAISCSALTELHACESDPFRRKVPMIMPNAAIRDTLSTAAVMLSMASFVS